MSVPITFKPIYMERVWGGRGLEEKLNRELPPDKVIGESWEVVDRPEAQSVVESGQFAGLTLRQLLEESAGTIMGPIYSSKKPFPILIKWLDCQEKLSLQVHPPAQVAGKLEGEPKTENWYIADAEEGAELMVGLKKGVTRESFEKALKNNELEPLVHKVGTAPGDSLFVWSGRIHAIGGGNFILEIQQNSDTTYRVYDWGRVGLDGKPRALHVDESMESIEFEDFEPEPLRDTQPGDILADCNEFRIRKESVNKGKILTFPDMTQPVLVNVVSGEIEIKGKESTCFKRGDTILLPYTGDFDIAGLGDAVLLITDHFA
ncbi:MAG: class I mannose-6-phosphate isomerase [Verrucomicrobiae bacterium]|nr:class I mannose-6-phosphate isomerase [Verrucomicrobiae bacterium]